MAARPPAGGAGHRIGGPLPAPAAGRLPGYRVEFVEANASRVEQQARQGETFCATQIKRTPPAPAVAVLHASLSGAGGRGVPAGAARRPGRADQPEGQRPSLAELLNQSGLRVQVAVGRSFNPAIDALLALHEVPRVQLDSRQSRRLLELVRGGRIDMTIRYGSIVRRFLGGRDAADGVTSLAFVEHQTPFDVMVACTRNAGGRAAIEAIDAAVRDRPRRPARPGSAPGARAAPMPRAQTPAGLPRRTRQGPTHRLMARPPSRRPCHCATASAPAPCTARTAPGCAADFLAERLPLVDDWPARMAQGDVVDGAGCALPPGSPTSRCAASTTGGNWRPSLCCPSRRRSSSRTSTCWSPTNRTSCPSRREAATCSRPCSHACAAPPAWLELSPLHRLDRETAGLVLFSVRASERGPTKRSFVTTPSPRLTRPSRPTPRATTSRACCGTA